MGKKKSIFMVMAWLLVVLMLASCGSAESEEEESENKYTEADSLKIRIYDWERGAIKYGGEAADKETAYASIYVTSEVQLENILPILTDDDYARMESSDGDIEYDEPNTFWLINGDGKVELYYMNVGSEIVVSNGTRKVSFKPWKEWIYVIDMNEETVTDKDGEEMYGDWEDAISFAMGG